MVSQVQRPSDAAAMIPEKGFRVATFNMHSGGKEIGKENLSLTARTIRNFDLVGLNEVRGPSPFRWRNQADQLGTELGMAAAFGPSERRWFVASFGNGLLSRFPIESWQSQAMRVHGQTSYRALITARITIADIIMTVMVVHVERRAARDSQLREVYERFATTDAPAILMGDFNSPATHPELLRIASLPGVVYASKDEKTAERIDHIYVKGLKVQETGNLPNEASDHPLVWTNLAYRDPKREVTFP